MAARQENFLCSDTDFQCLGLFHVRSQKHTSLTRFFHLTYVKSLTKSLLPSDSKTKHRTDTGYR